MDTFIEYMVKKKRTISEVVSIIGIAALASILAFVLFFIAPAFLGSFSMIAIILLIGEVYLAYRLITAFNIEYEYSLVNDEIDVDKIMDRKRRKKITTVKIKGLDGFGLVKNSCFLDKYMKDGAVKKTLACTHINDDDVYYAAYTVNEAKNVILFNPSEKMITVIKKMNPLKVSEFEL